MIRSRHAAVACLTLLASIVAVACNGDSDDASPTSATMATQAPQATATSTLGIREIDLAATEPVIALIESTEGEAHYVQENVIYADLTEDGVDDAVVPISSGGTLGNVGFVVLTLADDDDRVSALVSDYPGESISIETAGGKMTVTRAAPGPDDPECCPSFLEVTTYAWNGAALAIEGVEMVENPDAGTPTAGSTRETPRTPQVAPEGSAVAR